MRIIETEIYEFHELSEQAKENAKYELMSRNTIIEYFWHEEAIKSLYAFAEEIGINIIDYSICWLNKDNNSVDWDWVFVEHKDTIDKDYLTGYCMDFPLIETWNETKDVDDCINEWLRECNEDYEYQFSDENVSEYCEANECEFTKDGKLV